MYTFPNKENKKQARGCNQLVDFTFLHNDFVAAEMIVFTVCDYIYI